MVLPFCNVCVHVRKYLPHRFIVFISVFFGGQSGKIFKYLYKMALGRKCKVIGNIYNRFIRVTEKVSCLFYLLFTDVIAYGNSQILFKNPGQVAGREICVCCKILNGNPFLYVKVNIVNTLHNRL